MAPKERKYDASETMARIRAWCDLQERSQQEVRDKLYDWGLHRDEVESRIAELVTGNYLNEERFARAYVSGKFRIKKWGRIKILNGLYQKRVSSHCVQLGLQEIDPDEYIKTIRELIDKKVGLIRAASDYEQRQKLAGYLARKGYETDIVWDQIDSYFKTDNLSAN